MPNFWKRACAKSIQKYFHRRDWQDRQVKQMEHYLKLADYLRTGKFSANNPLQVTAVDHQDCQVDG